MDQGWAALGGALVGGLVATAGTAVIEWWRDRTKRRALAVALAGEALAAAQLVRYRGWLTSIHALADLADRGQVLPFSAHLPERTIPVARAAQEQAGILPGRLPLYVSFLVLYTDGFVADVRRLNAEGLGGLVDSADPEGAAAFYREFGSVLEVALGTCDQIVMEVLRLYPKFEGLKPPPMATLSAVEARGPLPNVVGASELEPEPPTKD